MRARSAECGRPLGVCLLVGRLFMSQDDEDGDDDDDEYAWFLSVFLLVASLFSHQPYVYYKKMISATVTL